MRQRERSARRRSSFLRQPLIVLSTQDIEGDNSRIRRYQLLAPAMQMYRTSARLHIGRGTPLSFDEYLSLRERILAVLEKPKPQKEAGAAERAQGGAMEWLGGWFAAASCC